jgi:hypothetical protein
VKTKRNKNEMKTKQKRNKTRRKKRKTKRNKTKQKRNTNDTKAHLPGFLELHRELRGRLDASVKDLAEAHFRTAHVPIREPRLIKGLAFFRVLGL